MSRRAPHSPPGETVCQERSFKMDAAVRSSGKVRVGIVGVGNCASSLVQGLSYYGNGHANEPIPGLMNVDLGGYRVRDVEVSAAFDVSASKVGRDVSEAIYAFP